MLGYIYDAAQVSAAQAAFEPKVRALGFATSVPAWRDTVELT